MVLTEQEMHPVEQQDTTVLILVSSYYSQHILSRGHQEVKAETLHL